MRIALVSNAADPARGGSPGYAVALAEALAAEHATLFLAGEPAAVPGAATAELPGLRRLGRTEPGLRKAAWHLRDQWKPSVHRALLAALRRFEPDVVHTHQCQGLSAAVFTAVARSGAPHVHTVHDANLLCARITMTRDGEPCGKRCAPCLLQRRIRRRTIGLRLDRLVAPSDHFRDLHVRAGIVPAERALTIRQGASPANARLRGGDGAGLTIGYIGELAPHKGVATLLEAMRGAPPTWRLRLAGSGPLSDEARRHAERDERIAFAGRVAGREKDAFFDALDVLVVPSEYEENAPLVLAEAAVRGLPAVVSDRGGLPETPEAFVFRARDARELEAKLRSLADAPARLRRASERLIAAREEFLWSTHLRRVEEVLRQAGGPPARRPAAVARRLD